MGSKLHSLRLYMSIFKIGSIYDQRQLITLTTRVKLLLRGSYEVADGCMVFLSSVVRKCWSGIARGEITIILTKLMSYTKTPSAIGAEKYKES